MDLTTLTTDDHPQHSERGWYCHHGHRVARNTDNPREMQVIEPGCTDGCDPLPLCQHLADGRRPRNIRVTP